MASPVFATGSGTTSHGMSESQPVITVGVQVAVARNVTRLCHHQGVLRRLLRRSNEETFPYTENMLLYLSPSSLSLSISSAVSAARSHQTRLQSNFCQNLNEISLARTRIILNAKQARG